MPEYDNSNRLSLWPADAPIFNGKGEIGGTVVYGAVYIANRDKDGNPAPDNQPAGELIFKIDKKPHLIPLWRSTNKDGTPRLDKNGGPMLGNATDMPGYFVNAYYHAADPQNGKKARLSISFVPKEDRPQATQAAQAQPASMGNDQDIPF